MPPIRTSTTFPQSRGPASCIENQIIITNTRSAATQRGRAAASRAFSQVGAGVGKNWKLGEFSLISAVFGGRGVSQSLLIAHAFSDSST
jgi:hypothetical protein